VTRNGQPTYHKFDSPYVDTVDISTKVFPEKQTHDLDKQMERLQIAVDPTLPRHDAYADVVYTAQALGKLIAKGSFKTVGELLGHDLVQVKRALNPKDAPNGSDNLILSFDEKGKLLVNVTAAAKSERVRAIDVLGYQGPWVHLSFVTGSGQNEKHHDAWVPVDDLRFRSPGKIFYELIESGQKLEKAKVLSVST